MGKFKMELNDETTGVVVVDVQGDFTELKNGSLAVQDTDSAYLEKVRFFTKIMKARGLKIFATQDYHPRDHISFYTNNDGTNPYEIIDIDGRSQVMWPPHCVMGTPNADLLVETAFFEAIVKKGCDPKFDSYSGFFDDGGAATGLDEILKSRDLKTLIIYGLATDYCVKDTAMDALKSGFNVIVIEDLCRGVAQDTTRAAVEQMKQAGIKLLQSTSGQL